MQMNGMSSTLYIFFIHVFYPFALFYWTIASHKLKVVEIQT
jgi:hypothetical protein